MQFELSLEYIEHLKDAIVTKDDAYLKAQLKELYAVDIALVLNRLDTDEANYLYDIIDEDIASDVLLEMEEDKREALLATFSTKEIAEQLDNMESDDAADMINELPEEIQDEVLSHIENIEQASDIADLFIRKNILARMRASSGGPSFLKQPGKRGAVRYYEADLKAWREESEFRNRRAARADDCQGPLGLSTQ